MKSLIKKIITAIVILGGTIVVGILLLCLVYMLPAKPIKKHVMKDIPLLQKEGNYTMFLNGIFVRMHPDNIGIETFLLNNRGMARDNYTDAIMLANAVYENDSRSILQKALNVYRYAKEDEMPIDSVREYLENGRIHGEISYARYWHGYLVILRPLLCFLTYSQIRIFNAIVQSILLIFLCREIAEKIGKTYVFCLLGAVFVIFPFVIPFCMQYSTAVYVMLVSCIIYLRHVEYWNKADRTLYYYMLVGEVTCYVDFLTYPIITLGTLLVISVLLTNNRMRYIVKHSFMWGAGYFGIWAGKWIVADVLTEENVIRDGIEQVIFRTSSATDTASEGKISALKAIFANFSSMTNIYYILGFLCLTVFLMTVMKKTGCRAKSVVEQRHFLGIIFLPIIWYGVVKNHSYDHSSFTYRALFVTVFALMAMLVRSCEKVDGSYGDYFNKK